MRLTLSTASSRALATGLVSAGLFAAVLGASGATAQDEALPDPAATPAGAALVAAPTATPEPAPTAVPEPSVVPTPAATAEPTPVATAEPTPAATAEPTPAATAEPTPSATAEATPAATAEATPAATVEATPTAPAPQAPQAPQAPVVTPAPRIAGAPARTRTQRTVRTVRSGACEITGVSRGTEAGIPGGEPALLSSSFAETSTSASRCDKPAVKRTPAKNGADHEKHSASEDHAAHAPVRPAPTVRSDGSPAPANPTFSLAQPGPARLGVPNFFIDKFRIPPFLLPIYQAAGMEYGIRWELLAAINEIETDYGRNLNVSSAGALGWMQFMPATWAAYGVDANKDGVKDPYNPVDAIFASARYLKAAGGMDDVRKAVFAYNHANWYVDSVLMRARMIGGLPSDFVGSLTGLTQGRFPVHADATYAGSIKPGKRTRRVKQGNAAYIVQSDSQRQGIDVFAKSGSPVVAVNDGRVLRMGRTERLGRYVTLQDVFGNIYTYGNLGEVAETYPSPRERKVSASAVRRELDLPRDPKPTRAATAGRKTEVTAKPDDTKVTVELPAAEAPATDALDTPLPAKTRLFANPTRPAARAAGGEQQLIPGAYQPAADDLVRFDPKHFVAKRLRKGSRVIGGTMLGRIGEGTERHASHLRFEIRPAGKGAPRIDPKPILDGWKLLESTAIYRANGKNPLVGPDAETPTIGQMLLMSKETLERRVLANPRIDIYECGRQDIRSGIIDRRVLATLEYLAGSGLRPTVTSFQCGHGFLTSSGNVSAHSSGDAVDIAAVNGIPIMGHQGKGSITETTIQRLLSLQGTMKPNQIISLMTFQGASNTLSMGDHDDHIHVGWSPVYGAHTGTARKVDATLKPEQWIKLIDRLAQIDNPAVREVPSRYAVKVVKRPSR